MSTEHGDRLTPAPAADGLSTGSKHPDVAAFDRSLAEHDARQLADELGYGFGLLSDGTILLEPPAELIPPIKTFPDGFVRLGHI